MNATRLRHIDAISAAVAGQQEAQGMLKLIAQGCVAPDLLHERLQAIPATGDGGRLRSFCRAVQKRLEAA